MGKASGLGCALLATALVHGCGLDLVGIAVDGGVDGGAASDDATADAPAPITTVDAGVVPGPSADDGGLPDATSGGCIEALCPLVASSTAVDVAVTSTALYWLDTNGGKVLTAALDGTGPRVLASSQPLPLAGILADTRDVYWTAGGKLRRVGVDGVGAVGLVDVPAGCFHWRDATHFLTSIPSSGDVFSIDVTTASGAQHLITGADEPWGVASSGNDVFYTNYNAGHIRRNHYVGGLATSDYLVSTQDHPRCMATDGASLWWADHGNGTLMKSTITGTGAAPLVQGQTGINGVAVDATYVYWTSQLGITRHPK